MAKFVPCVRNKRNDGLYPVYIRVYHNKSLQYINTGLLVSDKGLRRVYDSNGNGSTEITDRRVLKNCLDRIEKYSERINMINAKNLDCKRLISLLEEKRGELSFTEFTRGFINDMINEGRGNPARNYKLALSNLQKYLGKENIMFNELTSKVMQEWIDSMKGSSRKNSLYPGRVRAIFNAAIRKHNDYDLDIIKIRANPFIRVKIPKESVSGKRSIDAVIVNKIFASNVSYPEYDGITRKELAMDVSLMIFCLAGINAADLYDLKEKSLDNWKLKYNRKKTRDKSDGGAYMEISVPEIIRPLFKKYKGNKGALFIFGGRFADSTGFVKTVNKGLKSLCDDLGIQEHITTYTFRHSWATIAQNQCGASTEQVAFSLNHSSAHKVTEGYIRKDYSPVDALNAKVIDFVFVYTLIIYIPLYALVINLEKK
jgi:integrase